MLQYRNSQSAENLKCHGKSLSRRSGHTGILWRNPLLNMLLFLKQLKDIRAYYQSLLECIYSTPPT